VKPHQLHAAESHTREPTREHGDTRIETQRTATTWWCECAATLLYAYRNCSPLSSGVKSDSMEATRTAILATFLLNHERKVGSAVSYLARDAAQTAPVHLLMQFRAAQCALCSPPLPQSLPRNRVFPTIQSPPPTLTILSQNSQSSHQNSQFSSQHSINRLYQNAKT
jgi:hypothetical protein